MTLFWFEIAHFLIAIFGILVGVSAAALFFLVIRYERQLQTLWRAIGFSALAAAFLLFIFERKFPIVGIPALAVEAFAFISIYIGVFAEPKLSQLLQIGKKSITNEHTEYRSFKSTVGKKAPSPLPTFLLTLVIVLLVGFYWKPYVPAALQAITALFIALTIPIQVRRYQREKNDLRTRHLNLLPLLGYIALFISTIALLLFRLPAFDIVVLRLFTLQYSSVWLLGQLFLFIGFFFLAQWAWTFIRVRQFLRTYIVFLAIAIMVASIGSLVFTMLIFGIIEKNNLELMTKGAQTENLIMQERSDAAAFTALTIGTSPEALQALGQHQPEVLREQIKQYDSNPTIDILVYDQNGKIIISPTDPRNEGLTNQGDDNLKFVLTEQKTLKTFGLQPGVGSPTIIARAMYPVVDTKEAIIGVIEVDSIFDNAFVDYSKGKTGLDVTIYAGIKRSATTIYTPQDNISRGKGSFETDQTVISETIDNGKLYSTAIDRLGRPYYSAFQAIRDVNGKVIGMVSVGTPTATLFEETRQQLITTFLVVMLISLLIALVGYIAIRSFDKR